MKKHRIIRCSILLIVSISLPAAVTGLVGIALHNQQVLTIAAVLLLSASGIGIITMAILPFIGRDTKCTSPSHTSTPQDHREGP